MVQTTCTKVTINANGSMAVEWDNSDGRQFDTVADLQAAVDGVDTGSEGKDLARLLMLAKWLRTDPSLADTSSILSKTCTVNMGSVDPVQIG